MNDNVIRAAAFAARCAGAATAAYGLATLLGLPEAVWAAMSALIVSQDRLCETRSSLAGRIEGTLLGSAVTVAVSGLASDVTASTATQLAVTVAISAAVAHRFPALRVAMWTCPIILLTAQPSIPIDVVALRRGSEVVLGALMGATFHWTAELVVDALPRLIRSLHVHV